MQYKKMSALEWIDRFTYKKNIVFDETSLDCNNATFQIVRFVSHASIGEHWHSKTTELFFVQSGVGIAIINNQEVSLKAGGILLCEKGDHHAFINTGAEDLILLDIKFNADEQDIIWK